jgi:hypothetical protein
LARYDTLSTRQGEPLKDLPPFIKRNRDDVVAYISEILMNEHSGEDSYFVDLLEHDDGHYRVTFDPKYFVLQTDQTEPTKSQWNGLKKKLKRRDSLAFVFKEHGADDQKYYLDFGFLPPR